MTKFARLNNCSADYKARGKEVGIFLKGPGLGAAERGEGQAFPNHVGLLFVDPQGSTREFHFVTDNRIITDVLKSTKQYFHATLGLDEMNAAGFASYLSVFLDAGKMPRIKYGMNWFAVLGSFDESGNYRFNGDENDPGMTCSIFVSELLAGQGFKLIDYNKFPTNQPQDLEWRKRKIEAMRSKPEFSSERISALESIDPFVRLRPEDAAAVAAEDFELWAEMKYQREPDAEEHSTTHSLTITELAAEVVNAFAAAFP